MYAVLSGEFVLFCLENITFSLDVAPSNSLPHALSPLIPLCVILFKDLVAKQHPTSDRTFLHVPIYSNTAALAVAKT